MHLQIFICFMLVHIALCKEGKLQVEILHKPDDCSYTAAPGDSISVHYTGKLASGQIFDTSHQAGRGPIPFVLGQGRVIPGWEQGIQGMCIGEKRKLTIPPHLAYGAQGHPPTIPPQATLTFETELMTLEKPGVQYDIMGMANLLIIPGLVIAALYWVYDRYKKSPSKKDLKEARKGRGASSKKRH